MLLVPVLDIRHGQVVRAVQGERAKYQPIQSRLIAGSEPVAVARALLEASDSDTLYIADLDAMLGELPQLTPLLALREALPGVELWVDAAFRDGSLPNSLRYMIGSLTPVFASESLPSRGRARKLLADRQGAILSLDHHRGHALDAAGLWRDASLWPDRVIVMALDRVGSRSGPDLDLLGSVRALARQRTTIIGAGGVRDDADLDECARAGADAWLVATALHERRIEHRRSRRRPGTALAAKPV